jgi:hypothetical protein
VKCMSGGCSNETKWNETKTRTAVSSYVHHGQGDTQLEALDAGWS